MTELQARAQRSPFFMIRICGGRCSPDFDAAQPIGCLRAELAA